MATRAAGIGSLARFESRAATRSGMQEGFIGQIQIKAVRSRSPGWRHHKTQLRVHTVAFQRHPGRGRIMQWYAGPPIVGTPLHRGLAELAQAACTVVQHWLTLVSSPNGGLEQCEHRTVQCKPKPTRIHQRGVDASCQITVQQAGAAGCCSSPVIQ